MGVGNSKEGPLSLNLRLRHIVRRVNDKCEKSLETLCEY